MKVIVRKASDFWKDKKEKMTIKNLYDLKKIYSKFIIDFDVEDLKDKDIQAIITIYDDYVE